MLVEGPRVLGPGLYPLPCCQNKLKQLEKLDNLKGIQAFKKEHKLIHLPPRSLCLNQSGEISVFSFRGCPFCSSGTWQDGARSPGCPFIQGSPKCIRKAPPSSSPRWFPRRPGDGALGCALAPDKQRGEQRRQVRQCPGGEVTVPGRDIAPSPPPSMGSALPPAIPWGEWNGTGGTAGCDPKACSDLCSPVRGWVVSLPSLFLAPKSPRE